MADENLQTNRPNQSQAIPIQAWGARTQTNNKWSTVAQQSPMQDDVVMADDRNDNKSTNDAVTSSNSSTSTIYSYLKIPNPNRTTEQALQDPYSTEKQELDAVAVTLSLLQKLIDDLIAWIHQVIYQLEQIKRENDAELEEARRQIEQIENQTKLVDQVEQRRLEELLAQQQQHEELQRELSRLLTKYEHHSHKLHLLKQELNELDHQCKMRVDEIERQQQVLVNNYVSDTMAALALNENDEEAKALLKELFIQEAHARPQVMARLTEQAFSEFEQEHGRPVNNGSLAELQFITQKVEQAYEEHLKEKLIDLQRENGESLIDRTKVTDDALQQVATEFNKAGAQHYQKQVEKVTVIQETEENKQAIHEQMDTHNDALQEARLDIGALGYEVHQQNNKITVAKTDKTMAEVQENTASEQKAEAVEERVQATTVEANKIKVEEVAVEKEIEKNEEKLETKEQAVEDQADELDVKDDLEFTDTDALDALDGLDDLDDLDELDENNSSDEENDASSSYSSSFRP